MPQTHSPDSHFIRKMPKKQGKVTLRKLCTLLCSPSASLEQANALRQETLYSAFHWIDKKGKSTPVFPLLSLTQQEQLRQYLFPQDHQTPLLMQLHQLARLSETLHPMPKSQGVFYTPPELVDWLVAQSFQYITPLQHLRFCTYDPACGAGLFLWSTYLYLRQLYPQASETQSRYWQEHLLGTDTDALAVEVARFGLTQLWKETYPQSPLPHHHIQAGNALQLSHQALEHPGLFQLNIEVDLPALEHVDLIIGNPPYVGEKGNRAAFQVLKLPSWKKHYRSRGDLYYYFFYVTLHLLKQSRNKKAVASLLTPNYFFSATQARHLRQTLSQQAVPLACTDFDALRLFAGAGGQHNQNLIFHYRHPPQSMNTSLQEVKLQRMLEGGKFQAAKLQTYSLQSLPADQWGMKAPEYLLNWSDTGLLEHMVSMLKGQPLHDSFAVFQGIVTGADRLSKTQKQKYAISAPVGSDIFILSPTTYHTLRQQGVADTFFRPWYKSSSIQTTGTLPHEDWLLYLQRHITQIPRALQQHLRVFYPLLSARREVQLQQMQWFHVQWPRVPERFEGPKLVLPQRARNCRTVYTDAPFYASADVYFIHTRQPGTQAPQQLQALAHLLNHPLYTLIQWLTGKRKGRMLELYQTPLSELIIPKMTPAFCQKVLAYTHEGPRIKNPNFLQLILNALDYCPSEKLLKDISDSLWEWYEAR